MSRLSPRKLGQSTRRSREEPRGRTRRVSLECLELRLVLNAADMRFVGQAFLDLLGRPADSAGLAYWTGELDAGAPQSGIAQQLTHSAEYYGNEIIKPAYKTFLARDPDTSGLNFWVGQMRQGLTDEQLEAGFIGAPEFYAEAGGTDLTWVDAMYQDLLGRPADSDGQRYWVAQLQQGASRSGVAYGFAASLEREGQRIQADYQSFLRRGAGSSEVDYWVGQFANGMTNESVIGGFIGSPEYFNFAQTSTDTQPPALVDTVPADGAVTNLGSQTVRIDFSKPMNAGTLTASTLQLEGPAGAVSPTAVQLQAGGRQAQLTYPPLAQGDYQLTIHAASITDTMANALGSADIVEHFHVVNATDVWINPAGGDWNDPANWSTGVVPGLADDAFIGAPAGATITYSGGDTTIKSLISTSALDISGGNITLTTGDSEIDAALTMSHSAQISIQGAGATLTAKGTVAIDTGAEFFAIGGGLIDLSALTSFNGPSDGGATIQATGTGSKVDLSNLTVLHGATGGNEVILLANQGGLLDLHRLATIPDGIVQINASDPNSKIDLSALTTYTATLPGQVGGPIASLGAANGGTILVPLLVNVANFTLSVDGASSINTSQLTNVDTIGLSASHGAVVDLSGVESYTNPNVPMPIFPLFLITAQDAGSRIDLSNLGALHGAPNGLSLFLSAVGGGLIDLRNLTQISDGSVAINVSGPGSTVDLSSLTTSTGTAGLEADNGGTVLVPLLSTVASLNLTLDGAASRINTAQLANVGTLNVYAQNGAVVDLSGVTSYTGSSAVNTTIDATGSGSSIDLANLTVFHGANDGNVVSLWANQGGRLHLDRLTQIPDGGVDVVATDLNSRIDLPALTTFTGTFSGASPVAGLEAHNGGVVFAPLLSTAQNLTLTVDGVASSINTSQLANIDTLNVYAQNGTVVDLSGVTSYAGPDDFNPSIAVSGAGSTLDFSNLTVLHGATNGHVVFLDTDDGGLLDLRRLGQIADGAVQVISRGNSKVDLSALTTFTATASGSISPSTLTADDGGTIYVPLLTAVSNFDLIVTGGASSVNTSQISNIDKLNLAWAIDGAVIDLSGVASYTGSDDSIGGYDAQGPGSKIDLSNLTVVGGAANAIISLDAEDGAAIDAHRLTQVVGGMYIDSRGAGSLIDVSALTDFTSNTAFYSRLDSSNGGAIQLSTGTTTISNAVDITLAPDSSLTVGTLALSYGARLEGSGTLTGNLTNGGSVGRAGVTQAGSITVSGNYVQTATGTVYLNLGGTAAGTQFDQLIVGGTATLAGTLSLELVNAFTPAASDTFSIVAFPSSSGTFATVNGTDAGNGNSFVVEYEPADVKLRVQAQVVSASDVWINSAGGDWNDPANWSTGVVPGPTDDVYIDAPTAAAISYSSGAATIKSLTSTDPLDISGGSITLTAGASEIDGALSLSRSAQLVIRGAGATLTAKGTVSIDTGAEFLAAGGGVIDLSALTAFSAPSNGGATINATDAGSKVDLSNLSVLHGATGGNVVFLLASFGGLLDLHRLTQIPDGGVQVDASGANGKVDFSSLTTFTATSAPTAASPSALDASDGGTIYAPLLVTVSNFDLILSGAASRINTSQISNIALLNLVWALNGAAIDLSGVTSYTGSDNFNGSCQVSGAESTIDLSNLTVIHAANGNLLSLDANGGGLLDVRHLTQILGAGDLFIKATDANSRIDLSDLTEFTPGTAFYSSIQSSEGGAIQLGTGTTTVSNLVDITLAADGSLAVGTLVLSAGAMLDGSGTLTGNLTNGGSVAPGVLGQSTGAITVSGNYVQTQAGTLNVVIGGTTAGTQFDQLVVDGTATLAGTLSLELVNAFTPAASDTFSIIVFPLSSGTFATINGTDAGNGHSFVVDYEPADVKLSVT